MAVQNLTWLLTAKDEASAVFARVGKEIEGQTTKMQAFQAASVTVAKYTAAGLAVVAGVGVKMASDFQTSITTLVTGAGESENAIAGVSQRILDMAGSVGTMPSQLSAGMYLVESAGYRGAKGLDVLKSAAEGAKVGGADLATVADGLTTAMKDYNIPIAQAADTTSKLIATVGAGKTTMGDLSASLSQVLPFAKDLGISFNDTMGAMATMTGQGIQADQAATMLKFTIMSLANVTPQGVAALKSVGMSAQDLTDDLSSKGLSGTLADLTDAFATKFGKGTAAYNQALAATVGGTRGLGATLALTGDNATTFAANVKTIGAAHAEAGGHVKGFALEEETLSSKMDTAKASLASTAINLGNVLLPAVTKVTAAFAEFSGWMAKNKTAVDVTLGAIAGLTVTILAVSVAQKVWTAMQVIATAAQGIATAAQWAWNAAMTANPIGLVIVAIGLLVAAIVWIATKTTWFQTAWNASWGLIKAVAGAVGDWVTSKWGTVLDFFQAVPGKIGSFFSSVGDFITRPFRSAFNLVSDMWNHTIGKLSIHIPSWVPVIGGKGFDFPTLPHLATGGIVSKPTIAMIGEGREPEAVVPLSRLNQMIGGKSGANGPTELGDATLDRLAAIVLDGAKRIADGRISNREREYKQMGRQALPA